MQFFLLLSLNEKIRIINNMNIDVDNIWSGRTLDDLIEQTNYLGFFISKNSDNFDIHIWHMITKLR